MHENFRHLWRSIALTLVVLAASTRLAHAQLAKPVHFTPPDARAVASAAPAVQLAPVPDDFRHRVTVAIQWGPDNQFSGKMIESASGQTTQGAPINFQETSFDDVYGRMALFKIGVGYRTTPRSEAG